jgi:hypothetical protein
VHTAFETINESREMRVILAILLQNCALGTVVRRVGIAPAGLRKGPL